MAVRGLIYRCVHGLAPARLCRLFTLNHVRNVHQTRRVARLYSKQLVDPPQLGSCSATFSRSIYGMVKYWNALPVFYVELPTVKAFQSHIQHWAKLELERGMSILDMCNLCFILRIYGS